MGRGEPPTLQPQPLSALPCGIVPLVPPEPMVPPLPALPPEPPEPAPPSPGGAPPGPMPGPTVVLSNAPMSFALARTRYMRVTVSSR